MVTTDCRKIIHNHENPEERKGKRDQIYLIDGELNLRKYEVIEGGCNLLFEEPLTKFSKIKERIEKHIRDKDFSRIVATDRCLTVKGKTFNYHTGCSWGAESALMERIPFSNLLLGLNSYPECGFLVKNEGSSRKRITFAHR